MPPRRFFLASSPEQTPVSLSREESHHVVNVLRQGIGAEIELIDGSGSIWRGRISAICDGTAEVAVLELLGRDLPAGEVILIQSLCRSDKLEWILQKTTELGVAEIFLLNTERCVVKVPEKRMVNKLQRWQKIVVGAAKQSHRSTVPKIHTPSSLPEICRSLQVELKLLLSENERQRRLKQVLASADASSVAVAVGPEGGWTKSEEQVFADHGFVPVSLGTNILRSETASLVAVAILKYEFDSAASVKTE